MRPHRRKPTRLPHPWDSPGKNTGMGCHFLLQCMKVKSEIEVAQSCPTLSNPMDCSLPGSSVHGIFQARVLEWGAIAFSTRSFIISGLMFRSLIHFGFIFVYSVRKCFSFILLQVVDQSSQHHLLKRLSLIHCIFLPPVYETAKETLMYRTVLWTLWERERVGRFGRMALKHVKYHV